nr:HAMP domain-containing sensor histidine kinase [Halolactibacillus sp. JCM 19043]
MRLFFREHRPLVLLQCLYHFIVNSLLLLAGFRDIGVLLYLNLLLVVFFAGYLVYQYVTRKAMYHQLTRDITSLDDALEPTGYTPLATAVSETLKKQYRLYQEELSHLEHQQAEHVLFMDRWVHQMKTPLSVLELMTEDVDEPEAASMKEELERLRHGLSMVLYTARLRSMAEDIHVSATELLPLIHAVNKEHRRYYIRHHVYPKVITDDEKVVVMTDEKWLVFILTQLLLNAVKYSSGKSDVIHIQVTSTINGVTLTIKDFGVGIPIATKNGFLINSLPVKTDDVLENQQVWGFT